MFSFSNCTSLTENLLKARNSSRRHFSSPIWQKSNGSVLILYLHNSIWAEWQIVTAHNVLVWLLIIDSLLPCYVGKGKRGRAVTNKCIKLNCKHLPRRKNNLDWLPYLCFLLQKLVLSAAGKQIRIFFLATSEARALWGKLPFSKAPRLRLIRMLSLRYSATFWWQYFRIHFFVYCHLQQLRADTAPKHRNPQKKQGVIKVQDLSNSR